MERVSVVMAARNEEELIGRSIESLLDQSHRDFELLVVDDGSTDETPAIVRAASARDPRIRLLTIDHQAAGCVRPRKIGVENTKGEVVAVVEADAWYAPDYIERCLEALSRPGAGGVVGRLHVWEPRTWVSRTRDFHYRARWNDEENIRREIEAGRIGTWVLPRRVYDEVGGYRLEARYSEDRDLATRVRAKGYTVVYEPRALWHHKWEERPLRILKYYFRVGRQNVGHYLGSRPELLRRGFFLAPPVLAAASPVSPWALALLGLHLLVLYGRGARFLRRADAHRGYFFLFPFYLYLFDVSASAGFVYQLLARRPLGATGNP